MIGAVGLLAPIDTPAWRDQVREASRLGKFLSPAARTSDDAAISKILKAGAEALGDPAHNQSDQALTTALELTYGPYLEQVGALGDKTRKQYVAAFKAFAAFCGAQGGWNPCPCRPAFLAFWLHHQLLDHDVTYATVRRYIAAIRYAHRIKGYADPTNSDLVQAVELFAKSREKDSK